MALSLGTWHFLPLPSDEESLPSDEESLPSDEESLPSDEESLPSDDQLCANADPGLLGKRFVQEGGRA
ncbi:hypothetical protein ACXR0O_12140 [Verrucomicrobiota bacterium sgz303538]